MADDQVTSSTTTTTNQTEAPNARPTRVKRKNSEAREAAAEPRKRRKLSNGAQKRYENNVKSAKKKYARGPRVDLKRIEDKKLRSNLAHKEKLYSKAEDTAARAEILLPKDIGYLQAESHLDKTWKFKQEDIAEAVDLKSASKKFDLNLTDFGPYRLDYSRNGRYILLGGRKGHVGLFDWHRNKLMTELHLKETVRDVKFLHNETMFAVAQKRYLYVYDKQGTELHRLKQNEYPIRLEFLPYHFLLASVGKTGELRYVDTSTGEQLQSHATKLGKCECMRQNPSNAVIHLGHHNGVVTLWTPNMAAPVVKMLCHHGPVKDLVIDRTGHVMITAGLDGRVKVWDVRTYKQLQTFTTNNALQSIDLSDTGLLATSSGCNVQVWKDFREKRMREPYMTHRIPSGRIDKIRFCPYEDLLGIGHDNGFSQIIIPGAGEPNFDTYEANPFENKKQRREATVARLLEKIPPEMITLNPQRVGTVLDPDTAMKLSKSKDKADVPKFEPKHKKRGRSKVGRVQARKQANVIERTRDKWDKNRIEKEDKEKEEKQKERELPPSAPADALDRFRKNRTE